MPDASAETSRAIVKVIEEESTIGPDDGAGGGSSGKPWTGVA